MIPYSCFTRKFYIASLPCYYINIFYESGYIGLRNISVATQRAIKLVCLKWMFGFLPRAGTGFVTFAGLEMALCLFLICFITSSSFSPWWLHSVHLYCRAWGTEHDGGLDFSLQGTGTGFVTFAVALSIQNVFRGAYFFALW